MREDHAQYNILVRCAPLDLDDREGTMSLCQPHLDRGEPLACDVDEKILLHATSFQNADAIVMHGFDHRTCLHGMYVDGVYFGKANPIPIPSTQICWCCIQEPSILLRDSHWQGL